MGLIYVKNDFIIPIQQTRSSALFFFWYMACIYVVMHRYINWRINGPQRNFLHQKPIPCCLIKWIYSYDGPISFVGYISTASYADIHGSFVNCKGVVVTSLGGVSNVSDFVPQLARTLDVTCFGDECDRYDD
jgi:hypothetical protein